MKDLLVAVDETEYCKHRLAVAQYLASRFNSHVTGIHISRINTDLNLMDAGANQLLIENLQSRVADERQSVSDLFYNSLSHSAAKTGFISEQNSNSYFELAKINDLIVVSQPSPQQQNDPDGGFVSGLIMRSGRPVLLLPYIGGDETVGRSVLVAWDNSREASRAVHDALPLLKTAGSVHVVSVSEPEKRHNIIPGTTISEHLARHDVNVIAHDVIKNEVPVAETLLSLSVDYGIDLLVMGGYGHSRLREFVFGGVTRTILNSMTIPVLMAH